MYNLIKYISNYSETIGSLWFYSKDEATNFKADIVLIILLNLLNNLEIQLQMERMEF